MKTITIHHTTGPLTVTCHDQAADDLLARSQLPDWSVERYGEWSADWDYGDMIVAGRPVTNLEMQAHAAYYREQHRLMRDQQGCCGTMMDQGECWGCGGTCPVWEKCQELFKQMGAQQWQ